MTWLLLVIILTGMESPAVIHEIRFSDRAACEMAAAMLEDGKFSGRIMANCVGPVAED